MVLETEVWTHRRRMIVRWRRRISPSDRIARERALGQIELGDPLIQAVAAAEVDVGAQFLSVRQRVLDFRDRSRSGIRLRDEHREQALGARRANACCSSVSARSIDSEKPVRFLHQRTVDGPGVLPRLSGRRSPENACRAFIASSRMFMLNEFRQPPLPGRVRTSTRGPPLPLPRRRRSGHGLPESACRAASGHPRIR